MSFVPPLFKDLGKGVRDLLFKKHYGDKKQFKVASSVDDGNLKVETAIKLGKAGLVGNVTAKQKIQGVGKAEVDLTTENAVKGHVEFLHLNPGTTVKVLGGHQDARSSDLHVGVEVTHKQDSVAASANVRQIVGGKLFVGGSAAVGADGMIVGAEVKADTANLAADAVDYAVGAQFSQDAFTGTVTCKTTRGKKDTDVIEAGYIHKVNPTLTVGTHLKYDISAEQDASKSATVLTFGGAYELQHNVLVKVKANSDRAVEAALEQKLYNPALVFTVGALFDANKPAAPLQKFGAQFNFGDN